MGDAVLELVVTEYLFKNYPNPEGELTNWRAALVRGERISEVGEVLHFEDFLLLSNGEQKNSGKAKKIILANTFEALVGAIYLDKGYKVSKEFITKYLLIYFEEILANELYIDPKSRLQELTQEKVGMTPEYEVHKEWGPDHAKHFLVGVYVNKKLIAEGEGASKQQAQTEAAKKAVELNNLEKLAN
ncbi:MAG: Ribonuclease III [uncultured bacterium]|nr:MAG: Ribonuclease III [uncultured bacterium]